MRIEEILQIISYMLGTLAVLVGFIGGLIAYIFKRHIKNCDESKKDNREDHNIIHRRIDEMKVRHK